MILNRRLSSPASAALFAGLMVVFLFQVGTMIVDHSVVFDEPFHIGNALAYLKTGKVPLGLDLHLPLMSSLIGLSLKSQVDPANIQTARTSEEMIRSGYDFIFNAGSKPAAVLARARLPALALASIMAVFIFLWSARWYGPGAGILSLTLCVFEPNIISHAGLATVDMGLASLAFAALFFYGWWLDDKRLWQLLLSGVAAGFAIMTKSSAFVVFFWAFIFGFGWRWESGVRPSAIAGLRDAGAIFVIGLTVVVLYVGPTNIPDFVAGVAKSFSTVLEIQKPTLPSVNFFHGMISDEKVWYYLPGVFLLKTSLPFLILSLVAFVRFRSDRRQWLLWASVFSYFVLCSFSGYQRGVRYLLPVYPLLCVGAGSLMTLEDLKWHCAVLGLAVWAIFETVCISPNYLAYFNELIGGPRNGYKWLIDSNLDWGQDFSKLGTYLEHAGHPEIILASFGTSSPDYYIGQRQDLLAGSKVTIPESFRHINSANPARELLIVSATYLQGFFIYSFMKPELFSWLREKKPDAVVGYSQFIYDITSDADSHYNLGNIYLMRHQLDFALREFNRAVSLDPKNSVYRGAVDKIGALK